MVLIPAFRLFGMKKTKSELYYKLIILCCMVNLISFTSLIGQTLAFPGALGFGAYSRGGRGGDVYTVTNLNDSGSGSLRNGIESAYGPRTIVFSVSGIIQLKSDLSVDHDYITIAGQTAPGDGICLRDASLRIAANHVIVRYIRSRLGDKSGKESDAISIASGHNIMMDHCSASWSVDECFSCSSGTKGQIDSITVQWSIISEALNKSIHSKGAHGYGALIRGGYGAKYTYNHNLFAHNSSRNPRPGNYDYNNYRIDPDGLLFDFRNNVMYNWGGNRPGYDADTASVCRYNYVCNYGKPGPNSAKSGFAYDASSKHFRAFYDGNYFYQGIPADQWSLVNFGNGWTTAEIAAYKMTVPFPAGPMETESAIDAYKNVLAYAGASIVRDAVDARVMKEVQNGTGFIVNHEEEVGSWPTYKTYNVLKDSDKDGMPDNWEVKNKLNPNNPDDRNKDRDGDGYTNLEEYLNSLAGHLSTNVNLKETASSYRPEL
jgi:pectate lyase